MDAALWAELAFPPHRTRLPVLGGLPTGVERDDPLPPHPWYPFRPSRDAFRYTLARTPVVREPCCGRSTTGDADMPGIRPLSSDARSCMMTE